MAVPDNWDYSLRDVINEIGSGDSLRDCFNYANPDGFDPSYEGNKDSLRCFRNYTHVTQPSDITFTLTVYDEMTMSPVTYTSVKVSETMGGMELDSGMTNSQGIINLTVPGPGDYWVLVDLDWQEVTNIQDDDNKTIYTSSF